MNEELRKIKKIYGEEMMHLCRDLFPSILAEEGRLLEILLNNLAPTHSLAEDIIKNDYYNEFKSWIYSFVDEKNKELLTTNETPFELLDKAGYILYECKSEEDIQKFKKYYDPKELICTIKNGGRLNRCHVFFAIKKNVDDIKREMFIEPRRDDLYGTSVISIQFAKGENNTISIKNRYNHTVMNPDFTFNNDLDNIIPGLTKSFENYYNLNINGVYRIQDYFFYSLKYIKANNNRFYRYNLENNGIYFCENNIIVRDGIVDNTYANNKERYILSEQYVIDMKEKRILSYINGADSFVKSIDSVGKIISIEINKTNDNREIIFNYKDGNKVIVTINKHNQIIGYINNYVERIEPYFLAYNQYLNAISLDNVLAIDEEFLGSNSALEKLSLSNVLEIGNRFLHSNHILKDVSLPNVRKIGDFFLFRNHAINSISFPKVLIIGNDFISDNRIINNINLPKIEVIGKWFLSKNECLEEIKLDDLLYIDDYFLQSNRILKNIDLPKVRIIGNEFLKYNYSLTKICFNKLEQVGDYFLYNNRYIYEVILPKIKEIGRSFMYSNVSVTDVNFPCVTSVGTSFLYCNTFIKPNLFFRKNGLVCEKNTDEDIFSKKNR